MRLAILFDIDGTLMDTLDTIVAAMNAAADELAVSPRFTAGELRPMIGMPVERQLEELRRVTGGIAREFAERYYAHFTRRVERGVRLYPDVKSTFPQLADRRIGTMSTRRRKEAVHMLRLAGLERSFTAIVGGDQVARPKPNPDLTLFAARALRTKPANCVAVGDNAVDILAGRAAGMATVAALYGYGDPNALRAAGPDASVNRFSELPAIMEQLDRRVTP
ncbi:MAG TPA: HAD-IA family hydrolase [Thermoplasmata archaeon]|nr:HAD-IA family hydrolase [Thermoplasmata archaeon]